MAEQPLSRTPIRDFLGLFTNEDSHDLDPGQMQMFRNLQIFSRGQAQVRKGMIGVSFDNGISRTTNGVIAAIYYRIPGSDLIVYEDDAGNIKTGRNPGTPGTSSGTVTFVTSPSNNQDFVTWDIDGVRRLTTNTFITTPPYSDTFDTYSFSNGLHLIQPRGYRGPYRDLDITTISGLVMNIDFSDVSKLWTTSSKTAHVASDGDLIGAAATSYGSVTDFTASHGPTWHADKINGLGAAVFSASSNNVLKSTSTFNHTSGDIFIVASVDLASEILFGSASVSNANNWLELRIQSNVAESVITYGGTTKTVDLTTGIAAGKVVLINFRCNGGSNYDCYVNGVRFGSTSDGSKWFGAMTGAANLTIGGLIYDTGPTTLSSACTIGQVLVFNTYLSDANRLKVETQLAEKWGVPDIDNNTVTFSGVDYANTIPWTVTTDPPYNIYVSNSAGIAFPDIPRHYSHIRIQTHKYQAGITEADKAIFDTSIDLAVISDTTVPDMLRARGATAPFLIYKIISQMSWMDILSWENYADANGLDREDGWLHMPSATALSAAPMYFTSFSAQGFPVRWWWDAQKYTASSGVFTQQYDGTLGGTTGSGSISNAPWPNNTSKAAALSTATGDYLAVGYFNRFDELDISLSVGASGGWTGVIEYPTAVDSDGVATSWSMLTTLTDGTSGFTLTGAKTITFDPSAQTPAWVSSHLMAGGSGMLAYSDPLIAPSTGTKGYYLRIRTTSSGGTPPTITYLRAYDYTGQGDGVSGTVPAFDASVDADGDNYLNPTEYADGARDAAKTARFKYWSRACTFEGTNTLVPNVGDTGMRAFITSWMTRVLDYYTMYDGFFMDNSTYSNVAGVEEASGAVWGTDYGLLLREIVTGIPTHTGRINVMLPNMGSSPVESIVAGYPSLYRENLITEALGWSGYETEVASINTAATYSSPAPLQVVDCSYSAGTSLLAPSDRIKILLLAAYYIVSRPDTYFSPLGNNYYGQGTNVDNNWIPNRWIAAATVDIGQPSITTEQPEGKYTVWATAADPDDGTKTYKVYKREFDNAIVLYKPLSDNGSGTTGSPTGTPTTHTLGGTYYSVAADGTISSSGVTSVSLHNGEAAILMKAP